MMRILLALSRAVFSRYTLALLAVVVGSLALWLLGPLLSFGGLRPLQDPAMRVAAVLLLLAVVLCLLLNWSLVWIGIACTCLLVWHAGPLLAIGATHPLAPAWARAGVIALLLGACALYGLYRLYLALRADHDLLKRWLQPSAREADNPAKEELKSLAAIVRQAVAQLRRMRSAGGGPGIVRRIVEGKRHLYELPWYILVGVPGSGKTTALLNSGCKFPIAQQMGAASAQMALSANAGTLNTQWWFTNEAVLIDTAGRYTQQDDGQPAAGPHAAAGGPAPAPAQQKNAAEWLGYLGLLRKHRPRAPINGALLAVSLADLVEQDAARRMAHAALLRERLAELRRELGVRFPVYVIVTKADLLKGFVDYFGALTTEGRSQVWGATLPWHDGRRPSGPPATAADADAGGEDADATLHTPLGRAVRAELSALCQRLEDGMANRLQEEYDLERRQRLYALPQELAGVMPALAQMVEHVFLDSRFDATELTHSLRGIYFTSALQGSATVQAQPRTLVARLMRGLRTAETAAPDAAVGHRSYFLHDLLTKLVFREAHLVQPNLGWERRFRLLRFVGHAFALVLFCWLCAAVLLSYHNNRGYLADVGNKAEVLGEQVNRLFAKFRIDDVPDTLSAAQALPSHAGLDLADPAAGYRYGLYSAAPIVDASAQTYAHLQEHTLMPRIVRRIENELSKALANRDEARVFETLRVYLMLHDPRRYRADEVKAWVLRDWLSAEGVQALGAQAALAGHIEAMFSDGRRLQSPLVQNEGLVRRARAFLDGTTSTARLYERARAAMLREAPPDFTLMRVVGPQAGTVFTRLSGQPLERGVPGLYTYEGYHEVFSKRLPDMIAKAEEEDAWVMGADAGAAARARRALAEGGRQLGLSPLMDDVRRRYLTEYAQHWTEFLADIAPVTGTTLAFDLNVVRQLAAPDSPLARLARSAVRETTLSRPLEALADADKSYLDRAAEQLDRQAEQIKKNFGLRPESRLERQIVDTPFAALREVVTGRAEQASGVWSAGVPGSWSQALGAAAAPPPGMGTARPALDHVMALLNDFYTVLAVADTAIANNSLPPGGADPGTRLRMEASRLPAPFKEVLTRLAGSGTDKVAQGTASLLRVQAQAQVDRLLGLLTLQVSEPCKRGIEGRYPFVPPGTAAGTPDVHPDDFQALFAAGGTADEYFTKHLGPFVDTSRRPWRYKSPDAGSMMVPVESAGHVAAAATATAGPTLTGELLKLLAAQGPNPDVFARIGQIREVFFRESGGKRMAWKVDVKVAEVDPSINELVINMDGQVQRYVHGPVQVLPVTWPGPRGGAMAEITATPRIRPATSTIAVDGPWALFRLMERGRVIDSATNGRTAVEFVFDGRRAVLDLATGRPPSPLNSDLLRTFQCPGRA